MYYAIYYSGGLKRKKKSVLFKTDTFKYYRKDVFANVVMTV